MENLTQVIDLAITMERVLTTLEELKKSVIISSQDHDKIIRLEMLAEKAEKDINNIRGKVEERLAETEKKIEERLEGIEKNLKDIGDWKTKMMVYVGIIAFVITIGGGILIDKILR